MSKMKTTMWSKIKYIFYFTYNQEEHFMNKTVGDSARECAVREMHTLISSPRGLNETEKFQYLLRGKDSDKAHCILQQIGHQSINEDLTSIVCSVINYIAHDLFDKGFCIYKFNEERKIVYVRNKFFLFKPKNILKICLHNVFGIFFYRIKMKLFSFYANNIMPKFWRSYLEKMHKNKFYFDNDEYQKVRILALGKICKSLVWYQEKKQMTPFYGKYNALKISMHKIKLRDCIVFKLNKFFKDLNLDAEIYSKDTPSLKDKKQQLEELLKVPIQTVKSNSS